MSNELDKVKWPVIGIINYRNVLVEKVIGGFKVMGKIVTTPQQVDQEIDNSLRSLEKSIKP